MSLETILRRIAPEAEKMLAGTRLPPVDGRNEMEEALATWRQRGDELAAARVENDQLRDMVTKMAIESEFYRSQTANLTKTNRHLQRYADDLNARLDVITEIITTSRNEARRFAMQPIDAGKVEVPEDHAAELDNDFPVEPRPATAAMLAQNRL